MDLTEAILREEVYERLIGELEREDVSSDARDAVASFLQDLRRDGVEWHSIPRGRGYFEADAERGVFPKHAAPCTRATRIPGSVCMKFAHEHGCAVGLIGRARIFAAMVSAQLQSLQVRARARVSLGRGDVRGCRHVWTLGLFASTRASTGVLGDEQTCAVAADEWTVGLFASTRASTGVLGTRWTCLFAASNGHSGLFASTRTSTGVLGTRGRARLPPCYGQLDCLKYAREHGCPWDEVDVRACRR